jgi:hypothetical protein
VPLQQDRLTFIGRAIGKAGFLATRASLVRKARSKLAARGGAASAS